MDRRLKKILLEIPFYSWFLFFVLGPVGIMVLFSFSKRGFLGEVIPAFNFDSYQLLFDPLYFHVLSRTFYFAIANTALCISVAFPLAFFLSRLPPQPKIWAITLILVPFWASFLVRILAFMDILRLRPFGLDWVYTSQGILGALLYNYLPIAILPLYASMEKIENFVLEAAQDLGANRRQILFKVLIPLNKGALFTSFLFVFVPTMGEYLIPELVGGGKHILLGSFLQNQFMTARNWPLGAATICILIVMTLALIYFLPRDREPLQ